MRRDEPPVDWVYSIYVTPENEVCWESMRKFSSLISTKLSVTKIL